MSSFRKTSLEALHFELPKKTFMPLLIDDWTLAFWLGFKGKSLWYYVLNRDEQYEVFNIPKKSGGVRQIHNPKMGFKRLLKHVRAKILLPLCEELGSHVTAYQLGKGTVDAAKLHIAPCAICDPYDVPHTCKQTIDEHGKVRRVTDSPCVACGTPPKHSCTRRGVKIHMDLRDFFNSTKRIWIRQYFEQVVGYNRYVSTLLSKLLTANCTREKNDKRSHWDGVPQGAPTSGDICNLIANWKLDGKILEALQGSPWVYSRYADDLYFSHPENLSKEAVEQFISQLQDVISRTGYRVNNKKTRIQRPAHRQQVLGVVVNRKPGMPRDAYLRFRAILHNVQKNGFNANAEKAKKKDGKELATWLRGKISYYSNLSPNKAKKLSLMLSRAEEVWEKEVNQTSFTLVNGV